MVVLAALVVCTGPRIALAADAPAAPATSETAAPAPAEQQGGDTATPPAEAVPPVPQLQIQDEGPSSDMDSQRIARARRVPVDDGEEKPFWKHWLFWTVAGAMVAGAVGMAIYSAEGTETSLAPCPFEANLGCFGAGRSP